MNKEPILRIPRSYQDGKVTMTMRVHGGLHYIRGNSAPYFSLTYWAHRKGFPNQCESGGAGHDHILRFYPELADLAALHLSDIDGKPTHAEANGWYSLAGYFGGAGQEYHVGNSKRHFPVTPPADKPWQNTEYRVPTQDECLRIWADHIRVDIETARKAAQDIAAKWNWPDMREAHKAFIAAQAPRWKTEADACIAKHGLVIFGDKWPPDSE